MATPPAPMQETSGWRPTGRDLALLVALTLMWGINWPMMKFSLRELSPLWFRAWTMSGGALLLLAFFAWRGANLRIPRSLWPSVAGLALPNILGWHGLSIVGLSGLPSGRAASWASPCRCGPCWWPSSWASSI